jgi:hypothetical protein
LLHQVDDLFELNVKLECQNVNYAAQVEELLCQSKATPQWVVTDSAMMKQKFLLANGCERKNYILNMTRFLNSFQAVTNASGCFMLVIER